MPLQNSEINRARGEDNEELPDGEVSEGVIDTKPIKCHMHAEHNPGIRVTTTVVVQSQ